MYHGWCLDENKVDVNQGKTTFGHGFNKTECLEKCKMMVNASGCEYSDINGACGYHTLPVSTGSGDSDYTCWVFTKGKIIDGDFVVVGNT